jgi:hypothetical protein
MLAPGLMSLLVATSALVQPDQVAWRGLTLRAAKLGLSTSADLDLELVSSAAATRALNAPGRGHALQPRGDTTAVLTLNHSFLRRSTSTRVWFDPETGQALQRLHLESGRRVRRKTFRYTTDGVDYLRRSPDTGEEGLHHSRWRHTGTDFYPFPDGMTGRPVVEPASLFYLASACAIAAPGQSLTVPTFTRKRFDATVLEFVERRSLSVSYTEASADGEREVRGRAEAVCLGLRAQTLDGGESDPLRLMGLQGNLELCLDAGTRIPLQLTGRFRIVGRVRARLTRVDLRDDPPEAHSAREE